MSIEHIQPEGLFALDSMSQVVVTRGRQVYIAGQGAYDANFQLVVLALLWLSQVGFLLSPDSALSGSGLILAMALMQVVGGRITPAFSGNWLRAHGRVDELPRSWPMLDRAAIYSTLLVAALWRLADRKSTRM